MITAHVCDVNRPLLSVDRIVKNCNRVIFGPARSYIEGLGTGENIWLGQQGGVFYSESMGTAHGFSKAGHMSPQAHEQ